VGVKISLTQEIISEGILIEQPHPPPPQNSEKYSVVKKNEDKMDREDRRYTKPK